MKFGKAVANLVLTGTLSACVWGGNTPETSPVQTWSGIKETEIFLQEPFTRVVARCYATAEDAAEACAINFEQKGYVRLHNIPYKTARYDFLTQDTYPSRRWRFNERTPRW